MRMAIAVAGLAVASCTQPPSVEDAISRRLDEAVTSLEHQKKWRSELVKLPSNTVFKCVTSTFEKAGEPVPPPSAAPPLSAEECRREAIADADDFIAHQQEDVANLRRQLSEARKYKEQQ